MKKVLFALVFCITTNVYASIPGFQNLTQAQLEDVLLDFSSAMAPTTVSGAGDLGNIFGFEFGVVGGTSDAPGIAAVDGDGDPTDEMPGGALYGQMSFPMGIGVEALLVPVDLGDFVYDYKSYALYWSFGKLMGWGVDAKIKMAFTDSNIKFTQTLPIASEVTYFHKSTLTTFTLSKDFVVFTPYVGVGAITGDSRLFATVSVLQSAAQDSGNISENDTFFYGGFELDLVFLKLGTEVSNPYGNQKVSFKAAFSF
jgi:hypothetical protein